MACWVTVGEDSLASGGEALQAGFCITRFHEDENRVTTWNGGSFAWGSICGERSFGEWNQEVARWDCHELRQDVHKESQRRIYLHISNEEHASVVIWSRENALETVGWLYFPPSLSLYNNFPGQTSVWLGLWRAVHFVSPAGPPQATLRQEAAERSEALKLREKEPLGKQWTSKSNSNHFSSSNFPSQAAKRLLHSSCLKIQQVVLTWEWEDMESLKDSLVSSEKAAAALKVSLLDIYMGRHGYGFKAGYDIHGKFDHFLSSYLIIYFWAHH